LISGGDSGVDFPGRQSERFQLRALTLSQSTLGKEPESNPREEKDENDPKNLNDK